jgi:anti-sigma B factor antagonist
MPDDVQDEGPLRRELRPSGPVSLSLSESQRGKTTIVTVRGELDVLTAPKAAGLLDELVRGRLGDVVVDLRETGFLDSSGLSLLLNAQRRLNRRSRQLTVVCTPGPVRRVLELTRLIETLGVVPDLDWVD